jgi:outer membrane receptor protein involved in Fe transport
MPCLRTIFFYGFIIACQLFLCIPGKLLAQENNSVVSGTVIDRSTGMAIEFATVELLSIPDSSVIKTTVTDRKGKFTLEEVKAGSYVVAFSFIGYGKESISVTINEQRENLGTIEFGIQSKLMGEVVVTTRRSMLNTGIDRKIYNVSQDIMATSGSASEILKNIPSVEVDIEGQVTLRGAGDVMILINGRPSPLMGKNSAEVLQQLPANSIERIEVITNPSAKFRPDGTSGIINIVLKKNTKLGWNGSVVANAGTNSRYNGGVSLSYKPSKLNLFANYNIRQDRRLRTNEIKRTLFDSAGIAESYYTEFNEALSMPFSHLIVLGAEYTMNARNTFGISGNYFKRKRTSDDIANRAFYDENNILSERSDRILDGLEPELEKDLTAFWNHNFTEEDHELGMELNISSSEEKENNYYKNVFHFPVGFVSLDNSINKEKDNQQQATVNYTRPIKETAKLELGYDGGFTQLDLDFYGEYFDTTQQRFVKDIEKSNRFLYKEGIHAAYGTYERSMEQWGFSAGLRAEQVFIHGNLVTKDSLVSNSYFRIYPTLHLSYKLKKGELQLNYSKRVNRPDGDELNPFPDYSDPYHLRAGNPRLLPEVIHSAELGYKWENKGVSFVPSLYYRYRKNGFTSVTIPLNDSVLLTTEENLSNDQSAGLELIFSTNAGNFLSANLSSNIFYSQVDASGLGYSAKESIISLSTSFNSTFTLTKTTMLQLSCNYRSARLTAQGKSFPRFVFNGGFRQDLFNKKVSLTLTASDILKTQRQKNELNSPELKEVFIGRRDARVIYFGISYRFGAPVKKQNEENLEFDDSF